MKLTDSDRRALTSVAVQFLVNGAMTASFVSRLPELRDQIGIDIATFGLLITVVGVFGLASSLSAGRIVHSLGTRRVLVTGAFVMVLALPVIGVAATPLVWVAGMAAYSALDSLVDISMNMQGSWISARRRVPVMNRLHGLWSLGTVIGGLAAAQAAAAGLSLTAHLSIAAAVAIVILLFVMRGLLPIDETGHADTAARPPPAATIGSHGALYTLLALAGASAVVVEMIGGDWATFRLADDLATSPGVATLGFVAFTVGMTTARFAGDAVSARVGYRRLHVAAVSLATTGLALASFVPQLTVVLVGYLIAGVGVATFLPRLYDDAARAPGRRGAGLGAMTGGMRAAGLITPALVGAIAGTSLSVGAAIAIVTLPSVIAFGVVISISRRRLRGG
jgi:MFS family permease